MRLVNEFQADSYSPVRWNVLTQQAISQFFSPNFRYALVNPDGVGMLLGNTAAIDIDRCIASNGDYTSVDSSVELIAYPLLYGVDIQVVRIHLNDANLITGDPCYEQLINFILQLSHHTVFSIFQYTYAHLEKRTYDHKSLVDQAPIQFDFAEVVTMLMALKPLIQSHHSLNVVSQWCLNLIDVLAQLSKLGGARTVLQGHAVDFSFHLRVFHKLFLTEV